MQMLRLRKKNTCIGGHLLQNIRYNRDYKVYSKYRTFLIIKDDLNKEIHISRSTLKRYFILKEYV